MERTSSKIHDGLTSYIKIRCYRQVLFNTNTQRRPVHAQSILSTSAKVAETKNRLLPHLKLLHNQIHDALQSLHLFLYLQSQTMRINAAPNVNGLLDSTGDNLRDPRGVFDA